MSIATPRRAVVALALMVTCGAGTAVAQRQPDHSKAAARAAAASVRDLRQAPALRSAIRRSRARTAWRGGAAARRERLRSRSAYAGANRPEIARMLERTLGDFLSANDQVVRPGSVRRYTSDYTAVLDNRKLAVSSVPLRAPDTKQPLDLSLRSEGGGLAPTAPLAGFGLPAELGAGVELPGGVGLTLRSGAAGVAPSRVDSDTALYPNVDTDTDLLASSLPAGVELSSVLRSPRSPATQSFDLRLPAGAELKASAGGGASVVSAGRTLLNVSPPTATDAQGAAVPTTMTVSGDTLRIATRHTGGDWAYPILVDPTFTVWDNYQWASGARGFDGWRGYNNSNFSLSNTCMYGIACYGPNGLYVYSWNGQSYFNGAVAGYEYYIPGWGERRSTYISRVVLSPLYQYRQPREYNLQPFLFVGLWDPAINNWSNQQIAYDTYGYSNSMDLLSGDARPKRVNIQQYSNANVRLSGHHVSYVGAATIILDDGEDPVLDQPSSSNGPPTWADHETGTFSLHASDGGLGVHDFVTRVPDTSAAGGVSDSTLPVSEAPGCTGATGSLCPLDGHADLAYDTAGFPEGVDKLEFAAHDAATQGNVKTAFVLVDRSAPTMNVTGGLIDPALPDRKLRVDASDGDSSSPATARSGVKSIEILLDGNRLDYEEQPACNNKQQGLDVDFGSCGLSLAGAADANLFGKHKLTVVVKDQVGHATTREWNIDLPDRTQPQLEAHGPLVDSGSSPVAGITQLTLKGTDAGAGVRILSVTLDGKSLQSDVADCGGGGCEMSRDFLIDLSTKPAGSHTLDLAAYDGAGNQVHIQRTINLDPTPPALTISGTLASGAGKPLTTQTALASISASDAASGVAGVKVELDGTVVASKDNTCAASCPNPLSTSYTYDKAKVTGLSPHEVRITARDRAGNSTSRILAVDEPITPQDLQCPTSQPASPAPVSTLTPQQATMKIEQAQPAVIAASIPAAAAGAGPLDPSLEPTAPPATNMDLTGTLTGGEAPTAAAEGVIVGDLCMRPTSTTSAATKATIVHGDTALYANTAPQTDTVLRPTATGATTIEAIRGPQAPQTYSWKVGLTGSEQLKKLADGSIAVVDPTEPAATMQGAPLPPQPAKAVTPAGIPDVATQLADSQYQIAKAEQQTGQSVVAVIAPPWARDSAGTIVPATLTVSANTITLTVVHWTPPEPLAYPIYGVTNALGRPIGAGDASGSYSFGSTACSTGNQSDPIGAVFVGTHAGVSNTADMIAKHVGWTYGGQQTNTQGALVWFHGGGFRCRGNDEGMATADSFPKPQSRYHARLWLSWYPSGRPKTVATPHYEQFRGCSYWSSSFPGTPPIFHPEISKHVVLSNNDGPGGDSGFDLARHKLKQGFEAAGHRTENHFEGNTLIHHQDCDGHDNPARSDGYQVTIYENHTH